MNRNQRIDSQTIENFFPTIETYNKIIPIIQLLPLVYTNLLSNCVKKEW